MLRLDQENAIAHPSTEAEAEAPTMNVIQYYTSPPISANSASVHTEISFSPPAPEEINSHGGSAISSGEPYFSRNDLLNEYAQTASFS